MTKDPRSHCPDCEEGLSRREFAKSVVGAGAAVAGGLLPLAAAPLRAVAAPTTKSAAETTVKRFYDSLTKEQRKVVCFPFNHELRRKISANWAITEPTIEDFFTKDQQALLVEIFRGVTSPEGYERFRKQMEEDYGGFGQYHVAIFGTPSSGDFEWEMTGRHLTIRADGNSVANAAFGGPIIYGHGTGDSQKGLPGNVFYYQTRMANEVFQSLDGKQRKLALLSKAPPENAVPLQGSSGRFPGLAIGELSSDQKALVEEVIRVVLAPYREEDVAEALEMQKAGGGLDAQHLAFYESNDIGHDQVWDIWRLEGPTFVWHFRGAPHVHTYVNIGKK
jgi:hypothetical protein